MVLVSSGTFCPMGSPYFHTEKSIMVYTSLDRQFKMLFVDISFTKIGTLRDV